ncbi:FkbM family methyltransferase [Nocardia sp. NBC_01499]|uniref:FkbM family methyltransferase n=1 Tax=Nocardia sp. NBC_01499 TaxID=2903597 RepID=UPI00386FF696
MTSLDGTSLAAHPAVRAALVRGGVAYVVPDARTAPMLHRAATTELPDGLAWHEPADDLLLAGINRTETEFLCREVWADNAYLRHGIVLPERANIVDVGANIGMFTLLAAVRGGQGTRIVAVEPVVEAARALEVNGRLHGVELTVVSAAVGSREGTAMFTYYPGNTVMSGQYADQVEDRDVLRGYLLSDTEAAGVDVSPMIAERLAPELRSVPMTTLPQVISQTGLDAVDLLKVDVEKAEWEVLASIDEPTWGIIEQIAIEVHDLDGRLDRVLHLLRGHGYTVAADRDSRLLDTPLYTVYGHRPTARRVAAEPVRQQKWLTARALSSELGLPVELVATLDDIGATAAAPPMPSSVAVLAEVWTEMFGPGSARPDADFFALGGRSLSAVRLIAQVEARLGENVLELDAVFAKPRFRDLAAQLDAGVGRADR